MFDFIGGVIAGLVGVIGALLAFSLGIGALLIALAPLILVILILLLPVLILLAILRRIGLIGGPLTGLIALVAIIFLLMGGAHHFFQRKTDHIHEWLDARRDQLDECKRDGNDDIHMNFDGDDLVITCKPEAKPQKQPGDAHI